MTKPADSPSAFGRMLRGQNPAAAAGQRFAQALAQRLAPALPAPTNQAVPDSRAAALADTVARCKRRVTQRALLAAGAAVVPIPGLDLMADVALLSRLLDEISREFGLSEADVARLAPAQRIATFKSIAWVGNQVIGRALTHALVLHALKGVAGKLGIKQVTKFVPIAGQALSATLAFAAMRHVCLRHIDDCVAVRNRLVIELAQPQADDSAVKIRSS